MWEGFTFHSSSSLATRLTFPLGFHSLGRRTSASSRVGYWYREHTSTTQTPILFVHGIGIGFYTYGSFLGDLNSGSRDGDGVGIIALELTSISSRISAEAPSALEVKDEVEKILEHHGWHDIVLVGHS